MKPRKITNQELADLPEAWQNANIDTADYIPSALEAWEVDRKTYDQAKANGLLCLEHDNRFYIA